MKTQHTPMPWILSDYDGLTVYAGEDKEQTIATFEDEKDAIRSVRAVNSHDALMRLAENVIELLPCVKNDSDVDGCLHCDAVKAIEQAEGK